MPVRRDGIQFAKYWVVTSKELPMSMAKKAIQFAPTRKVFGLVDEFKNFALKGNVVDLAVGVIIGAAFGKIVNSLVKDVLMPLISLVIPSEQSYTGWKLIVAGKEVPYGLFLGELMNFVIVAAALFLFIVKFLGFIMRAKKAEAAAAPAEPPPPTREEVLLTEIRDLLKTAR